MKNDKKVVSPEKSDLIYGKLYRSLKLFITKHKVTILILAGLILLLAHLYISSLPAPELQKLAEDSGAKVTLKGKGFLGSSILIYVNDEYWGATYTNSSGEFTKDITFDNDGAKNIKVKQAFLYYKTEFSRTLKTVTDLTPPDPSTFLLTSNLPETTDKEDLLLTAKIDANDTLSINDKVFSPDTGGVVSTSLKLSNGANRFVFKLADKHGNTSKVMLEKTVTLDTSKPTISSFGCSFLLSEKNACVEIGDWTGFNGQYNSIAITGKVGEQIASVTVDGKNISWDENRVIYQRISLFINGGLNKYRVVATDKNGNVATGYVQTTSESTYNSYKLDIN